MHNDFSRRTLIQAIGASALVTRQVTPQARAAEIPGPRAEGPATPKICLEAGGTALSVGGPDPAGMRRVKQLGVDHVLMGGPPIPWQEDHLRPLMASF